MRRLILSGIFLILAASIGFLWLFRFERTPGFSTVDLASLRERSPLPQGAVWSGPEGRPQLDLRAEPGQPGVVLRMELPHLEAMDFLHLRIAAASRGLEPGSQPWDDGRAIIEWHPPSAGAGWENDPVLSARGDNRSELTELVMRPERSPAMPTLRIENLGKSGDFEVSMLEISAIQERRLWKAGRWILMAAWVAWAIAWIRCGGVGGFVRPGCAALVWLFMGLYFVVPGPWKSLRPIGESFQIGERVSGPYEAVQALPDPNMGEARAPVLESAGKMPDKGDFTLWLKFHAANARPLLHVLLLFGPTLLMAWLVGRFPAWSLAAILAVAIEAAQFSFGYGFDWVDCFDLVCDSVGIALGLAAANHPLLRERLRWSSEKPCRSVPVE